MTFLNEPLRYVLLATPVTLLVVAVVHGGNLLDPIIFLSAIILAIAGGLAAVGFFMIARRKGKFFAAITSGFVAAGVLSILVKENAVDGLPLYAGFFAGDIFRRTATSLSVAFFAGGAYYEATRPPEKQLRSQSAQGEPLSMQVLYLWDSDQVLIRFSKPLIERYQLDMQSTMLHYDDLETLFHPDDLAYIAPQEEEAHGRRKILEFRVRFPGQTHYTNMFRHSIFDVPQGKGFIAYDASEVERIDRQLSDNENVLATVEKENGRVVSDSHSIILKLDSEGRLLYASRAAIRFYDMTPKDVLGEPITTINESVGQHNHDWFYEALEGNQGTEIFDITNTEGRRWIRWCYEGVKANGRLSHIYISGDDVTPLVEANLRIEFDKYHDELTGLLNQRGLYREISALTDVDRGAAFFIDIDNFSQINDYYGHETGNRILISIADFLRGFESKQCFASRYSGDQFVLYCHGEMASEENIQNTLKRLSRSLSSTHRTEDITVEIKKNIGYATYPEHTHDLAKLVSNASLAMKQARHEKIYHIVRYEPHMTQKLQQNIHVANKLRQAINSETIDIHFQEVKDTETNRTVYVEQLARWIDETIGAIPPEDFISIAIDSNLILTLERYLVDRSLELFSRHYLSQDQPRPRLAINLAPQSIMNTDFLDYLLKQLDHYGMTANDVVVEISEKTFVHHMEHYIRRIDAFKEHSFTIALDDFGKEYSSLGILDAVPFDIIKIDSLFTQHLDKQKNREIVRMIRRISELSGKQIVAEGVEEPTQRDRLMELGCTIQQGYLFDWPDHPDDE